MAFNNFPYTNFQDLNLNWILNTYKNALNKALEALGKATAVEAEVGTYTEQINAATLTANQASATANQAMNIARNASEILFIFADAENKAVNYVTWSQGESGYVTALDIYNAIVVDHKVPIFMDRSQYIYEMAGYETNPSNPLEITRFRFSRDGGNTRYIVWIDRSGNISYTNAYRGGGTLVVNITNSQDSGTIEADKTYSEIENAYNSGMTVQCHVVDEIRDKEYYSYDCYFIENADTGDYFGWFSPYDYDNAMFYRAFIREDETVGISIIPVLHSVFNGLKYGADPTGVSDSSAAINSCINAEGYCSLPRGTYKTTSPIIMDGYRDELLVDGRINYTGDDAAIYVKNGFCHIVLDSLYSLGRGLVLQSTTDNYTTGLAGYGVFDINHIKSTKECIVLDSSVGGIHYNTFNGDSLWTNCDQYGNLSNDRTYDAIKIVNVSPKWNSRNVFSGYAVIGALNGIYIDGGVRTLCYGNVFNDFSFEQCTNNFNANHFMNTVLSNAAMQEKASNTKCLILADFGKGNRFSFTELLIERIDVDVTGLSEAARVDIEGSLISDAGSVLGHNFVISAYGSYSIDPGMTPLRVNAIANRRYTTPLNSLHFYGYGDTGTITLPSYIGGSPYREHEFWYTHVATNAVTLVDSAGNTALDITGGSGSSKVYHCVYVQGIGWKNS